MFKIVQEAPDENKTYLCLDCQHTNSDSCDIKFIVEEDVVLIVHTSYSFEDIDMLVYELSSSTTKINLRLPISSNSYFRRRT